MADLKHKNKLYFDIADENRRFEINLLWKRATIFWGFLSIMFVGVTSVGEKSLFLAFTLSGVGFLFSIIWSLANRASKDWQESFELRAEKFAKAHADANENPYEYMEDTDKKSKTLFLYRPMKYSLSKLLMAVSDISTIFWFVTTIYYLFKYSPDLRNKSPFTLVSPNVLIGTALFLGVMYLFVFLLFCRRTGAMKMLEKIANRVKQPVTWILLVSIVLLSIILFFHKPDSFLLDFVSGVLFSLIGVFFTVSIINVMIEKMEGKYLLPHKVYIINRMTEFLNQTSSMFCVCFNCCEFKKIDLRDGEQLTAYIKNFVNRQDNGNYQSIDRYLSDIHRKIDELLAILPQISPKAINPEVLENVFWVKRCLLSSTEGCSMICHGDLPKHLSKIYIYCIAERKKLAKELPKYLELQQVQYQWDTAGIKDN